MTTTYRVNDRIITSLLDTDWYKLTMLQGVYHKYPNASVKWEFRCRSSENLRSYLTPVREQIETLPSLQLRREEADYLLTYPYMSSDFVRFLELFSYQPRYVDVRMEGGELCITIEGPWAHTTLFETAILAIVGEVRNQALYPKATIDQAVTRLRSKLTTLRHCYTQDELAGFNLADFGTRRRLSQPAQEAIIEVLEQEFPGNFVGTSNVDIARRHDLCPMGTMTHEWFMANQQLGSRLIDSQRTALKVWVQEYRGYLGIAMTDTITLNAFLHDFDLYFAKLFDGLHHDSGDPMLFADKCIRHYESLEIDPMSKVLTFSDSLTFERAMKIKMALEGRIKTSFGVGTSLTCDVPGVQPMNITIKMMSCNGQPVAKVTDEPSKVTPCDQGYVQYLKQVFQVEQ